MHRTLGSWWSENGPKNEGLLGLPDPNINPDETASFYRERFPSHFIFTIVRNPYDRFLSHFLYRQKQRPEEYPDFKIWAERQYTKLSLPTQVSVIDDSNACDFIARFENLSMDIKKVAKIIGIKWKWSHNKTHANRTKHEHYSKYYDEDTKEVITHVYREDLKRFNYEY
jgi:hypothetical protein